MSNALAPLPQAMPWSTRTCDSMFLPSQIVPFPTALHVCHERGGGLSEELWGAEPAGSGTTALQVRVSQLGKALGPAAERLETKPPGYALRVERNELDLDRFSQLVQDADGAEPAVAAELLRDALAL